MVDHIQTLRILVDLVVLVVVEVKVHLALAEQDLNQHHLFMDRLLDMDQTGELPTLVVVQIVVMVAAAVVLEEMVQQQMHQQLEMVDQELKFK